MTCQCHAEVTWSQLRGVDTMLSGAVHDGLCDLDMMSGAGDTGVGGVDTVVSGAVSQWMSV